MYEWIKAFHLIAVISWMAGLLYLPRLFVYHCEAAPGSVQAETFKTMERRLFKAIMRPAMIATWLLGLTLIYLGGLMSAHWLHVKLLLVVLLTGAHEYLGARVRDFAADANIHSQRFYRVLNEVPTVLMIAIVILAVVKPF